MAEIAILDGYRKAAAAGGGEEPPHNWLLDMKPEMVFLADVRNNMNKDIIVEFEIHEISETAILMTARTALGLGKTRWYSHEDILKNYSLREIIRI